MYYLRYTPTMTMMTTTKKWLHTYYLRYIDTDDDNDKDDDDDNDDNNDDAL